jgi:hypothetical protein
VHVLAGARLEALREIVRSSNARRKPAARRWWRHQTDSILMGRIFDAEGNRMTPTYAVKTGVRYRYYISAPLVQGQPEKAAKLNRIPAAEIERLIAGVLRKQLAPSAHGKVSADGSRPVTDAELLLNHVNRVDVKEDHLVIQLAELDQDDKMSESTNLMRRTTAQRPLQCLGKRVLRNNLARSFLLHRHRHVRTTDRSVRRRVQSLSARSQRRGFGWINSWLELRTSSRLRCGRSARRGRS